VLRTWHDLTISFNCDTAICKAERLDEGGHRRTVCDGAGLASPAGSGKCAGNMLAFLTAFGTGPATSAIFATADPIWIFKDINANGSSISEVNQVYTSSTVPEPMTLSMMGVGLLGLGLISRRRKKS